ncbi:MAG: hypothetical protein H6745_26540 [Deltaproteobacteria bacterium]|nr:hypothetical protein [Deltaproteobacteria bacterium]
MRDTQPYLTALPVDTSPQLEAIAEEHLAAHRHAAADREATFFRGELHLLPGAGPALLGLLDSHPVLAGIIDVFLDRARVRRPEIALSEREWSEVRRGLVLATSYASSGTVVAQTAKWSLSFEASGDALPAPQRVTADMQAVRTPATQVRAYQALPTVFIEEDGA